MAYFFFTKDILKGKTITVFESPDKGSVARDFTYIDDIVKGCLGALDTAEKSTGSGGKNNDGPLLHKLFDVVPFTHILHLAAQAGVRYAMKNPQSYIASNIAGFVNLLEVAKAANPQPAIVLVPQLGKEIIIFFFPFSIK